LSQAIHAIRSDLIALLAEIEAAIDFPDDVEPPGTDELTTRITAALATVERLLATADAGRLYREGAAVVIAGRPNVGKSSLLNALLRDSRAIVTEIASTTRDVLERAVNVRGLPPRATRTDRLAEPMAAHDRIGGGRCH